MAIVNIKHPIRKSRIFQEIGFSNNGFRKGAAKLSIENQTYEARTAPKVKEVLYSSDKLELTLPINTQFSR